VIFGGILEQQAVKESSIKVYFNKQMAVLLLMAYSSGLPFDLSGDLLGTWMTTVGIDLKTIGFASLVGIPYAWKFAWAPLMDRYVPPFLGRRRGWMIVCQVGVALAAAAIAMLNPATELHLVLCAGLFLAFASASQDIVIDAYRAEVLPRSRLGAGAGVALLGYRIGMLTSGGLALIMADRMSWRSVYLIMAGLMALGALAALFGEEPEIESAPPRSLNLAIVEPLREFFKRPLAVQFLLFVVFYNLGNALSVKLLNQFLIQTGFALTEIGVIKKWCGIIALIVGSLIGGGMVSKIGIKRSLIYFGLLQAASISWLLALSLQGKSLGLLVCSIVAENLCMGLAISAYTAMLMTMCDKRYTATQYALLTSVAQMARIYLFSGAGVLVEWVGWPRFFILSIALALPGIWIAQRFFDRWIAALPKEQAG
jgi:PAT family beta-lactamase induction signal transducer AmpG